MMIDFKNFLVNKKERKNQSRKGGPEWGENVKANGEKNYGAERQEKVTNKGVKASQTCA